MKRYLTFLLSICVVLLINSACYSQSEKTKGYKAIIITTTAKEKFDGILQEVKDSTITVTTNQREKIIPSRTIQTIRIKRVGAVGRNALTGGLIGIAAGAVIGFASGDDEPGLFAMTAEEKAAGAAIGLGFVGAAVGAISGLAAKETIEIKGDQHVFQQNVVLIKKYALASSGKK